MIEPVHQVLPGVGSVRRERFRVEHKEAGGSGNPRDPKKYAEIDQQAYTVVEKY